jgi:hypothetical protein
LACCMAACSTDSACCSAAQSMARTEVSREVNMVSLGFGELAGICGEMCR